MRKVGSLIVFLSLSMLSASCLSGAEKFRNNDVDRKYNAENGWNFYYDKNNTETNTTTSADDGSESQNQNSEPKNAAISKPQSAADILDELVRIAREQLKTQREQLKTQKEILAILKEQFAPEPKLITLPNGKRCIENSSAECFVMPVIAEARRVPALAELLKNPTDEEVAKNYLQWQARYFEQVINVGNGLQFAMAKFGSEAYPIDFQRPGYDSATGAYGAIKEKFNKKLLASKKNLISFNIYFGRNIDLDIYAIDNIAEFMSEMSEIKFKLIFADEASKKYINDAAKTFKIFQKALKNGNVTTAIESNAFERDNIETTPTVAVVYMDNNTQTVSPIVVGRATKSEYIEKAIELLEYKKIINRVDRADLNVWKGAGNYSGEYLEQQYGIKLDKSKIKGYYNGTK